MSQLSQPFPSQSPKAKKTKASVGRPRKTNKESNPIHRSSTDGEEEMKAASGSDVPVSLIVLKMTAATVGMLKDELVEAGYPWKVIHFATKSELMAEAFAKMALHEIASVPVVTMGHKFAGFLDMNQIVQFVCVNFPNFSFTTFDDFDRVYREVKHFHHVTVGELTNVPIYLEKQRFLQEMPLEYSIFHAFEALAHGVAHIAVCKNHVLQFVVTQSMALRYLKENLSLINEETRTLKLEDMRGRIEFMPLTIKETDRPLNAYNLMLTKNICSIGVVNESGQLIDVLSVKDLASLKIDSKSIWRLYGTIAQFKAHVKVWNPDCPRKLVCLNTGSTWEQCLVEMVKNKVHHVYTINEDRKAMICIRAQDLLFNCLPHLPQVE